MFQTLIKLLTATTFVAHGLLGCCWHHTHPHAVSLEQDVVERDAGCHGHRHQHAHHGAGERATASDRATEAAGYADGSSDAPLDPECDDVHCVFIRSHETVNSACDLPPALVPFVVTALFLDVQGRAEFDSQGFGAFCEAPLSAVPLCALCQVWLI